ncbi:GNAT domain [Fusarium oxysporum f. sp. vasinfectum]|uniref:N-acetyltransferase domain-containing protein n=1 Tax=Fusarium oxysporum f. sp. vasinfectum 25433 TaxID=1089449 RepID=X0LWQ1_FUSOX|nr:hypothetical protein FOTG_07906 [Fusarium oxysporum f. sp. vasinfectum 25433]KAK2675790.1 GNAT domain [Fusarium oxysporum f. sp. vasinfectum]KAK2932456.1 GNAT domain [Fusarium oxysporum f. sp. vasinfectum]
METSKNSKSGIHGSGTLAKWRRRSLIPPTWETSVRFVNVNESAAAGSALAQAFATDAMSQYVLDGDDMADYSDEQKWKLHVDYMTYMVAAHCYKGMVTTIGSDYDAVALWLAPGQQMDDWWTSLRSGMWKLYYQLSAEGRRRYYDEMIPVLDQTKEEVMGERNQDCYYLVYIGTKPNAQGRGYAGKLIRDMVAKADAEQRPMYLESSTEHNNGYYAKFGFEVKCDVVFEGGPEPITMWIMVREPQKTRPACSSVIVSAVSSAVKF